MAPREVRPTRVLVADPHPVVRAGLRLLLGPGVEVVGEAADGPTALALAAAGEPDVVVVGLPGGAGVGVTARLRAAGRRVLVLAACGGALRPMLEAGAAGYALKRSPGADLVAAVRAVAGGGMYIDPTLAGGLVGDLARSAPADLSDREAEVVRWLARGHGVKAVAARLKVGIRTVETYRTRAMEKLGLRDRVDLIRYAVRWGWLADG